MPAWSPDNPRVLHQVNYLSYLYLCPGYEDGNFDPPEHETPPFAPESRKPAIQMLLLLLADGHLKFGKRKEQAQAVKNGARFPSRSPAPPILRVNPCGAELSEPDGTKGRAITCWLLSSSWTEGTRRAAGLCAFPTDDPVSSN